MIRFFGFGLIVSLLMTSAIHAAEEPKEISYIDLKLGLEQLLGKSVRLQGGFHYLSEDGNSFFVRMEGGTVLIDLKALPSETLQEIRALRNFSEIPVTITGVVRRGGAQRDEAAVNAKQVEIEDTSTRNSFSSRKGIVTVPELRVNPFRYLHSSVTMQGRFDFLQPGRDAFRLWRGVDEVEVDFGHLPDDLKRQVLGVKNFSDQSMKVTGLLRPSTSPEVAFLLEATTIQIDPVPDSAQPATDSDKVAGITYAEILQRPERYLNKAQVIKGGFEVCDAHRKVFQIWEEADSMEISYRDLPVDQAEMIESQKPFSSILLVITGKLHTYPKNTRRYLIDATDVSFDRSTP